MNIETNLLPWREIQRKNERRRACILALVLLAALAIIFLVINYYINGLVEKQQDANQELRNEIEQLNISLNKITKIKKEKSYLIARISLLQKLENSSVLLLHFFDELNKIIPEEIYLSQIKRMGKQIVLQGNSYSNQAVSLFMQKIENNAWMNAPNLIEIKNENEQKENNSFTLGFTLKEGLEL